VEMQNVWDKVMVERGRVRFTGGMEHGKFRPVAEVPTAAGPGARRTLTSP